MKLFHISPAYNRKSIMKYGLVPSIVKLEHHKEAFEYYGLLNNQGKCLYTWIDSLNNEKFIKDMIYCITWINPRNIIAKYYYENGFDVDMDKFYNKQLYPYSQMEFDVYSFSVDSKEYDFVHEQYPSNEKHLPLYGMDDKYSHTDKKLKILKNAVYNSYIVGSGLYIQGKHNNMTIKILR